MIKQYTVEYVYPSNSAINTYVDGKLHGYKIMFDWEVEGYCCRLKEEGFTRAYDLDELYQELLDAKENYEQAKTRYEEAKPYALIKEERQNGNCQL